MITSDKIRNASDHLTTIDKAILITWFRESDLYRKHALVFSGTLVSRVDAAEGTVKARMLNALIKEIDNLGIGQVEIRGDRDAVWWNQETERQALLGSALRVLFDDAVDGAGNFSEGVIPSVGLYGDAAVGQRPQLTTIEGGYSRSCCGFYPYCGCYFHGKVKSYPR